MTAGGRGDDAGAVVAEFAVALPAIMIVLALGLGALSAGARQVQLQNAAADGARLAARGEDAARVASAVEASVPGASAVIDRRGDLVCVTATASAGGMAAVTSVSATGCALAGGL